MPSASNAMESLSVSLDLRPNRLFPRFNRRDRIKEKNNNDTKLLLANVGSAVTASNIIDVFYNYGEVVRAIVHYNANEEPIGTAEVWMKDIKEANRAQKVLDCGNIFGDGHIVIIENASKLSKFWNTVLHQICESKSKVVSVV